MGSDLLCDRLVTVPSLVYLPQCFLFLIICCMYGYLPSLRTVHQIMLGCYGNSLKKKKISRSWIVEKPGAKRWINDQYLKLNVSAIFPEFCWDHLWRSIFSFMKKDKTRVFVIGFPYNNYYFLTQAGFLFQDYSHVTKYCINHKDIL